MKVEVVFDEYLFKYDTLDEAPRVLVFTDSPGLGADGLPFAVVPLGSSAVEVEVPSTPQARCVTVQCVAVTRTDFGPASLNMCGKAEFPALCHTPQRQPLVAREAENFVHGSVQLRLAGEESQWEEVRQADRARRCMEIARESTWWFDTGVGASLRALFGGRGAYPALDANLAKMHIEFLDYPTSGIPNAFFMYHKPRWVDSELMLASAAASAGARLGWSAERLAAIAATAASDVAAAAGDAPHPDTVRFAVLVAEMLQLISNSMPYLTDTNDGNRRGDRYVKSKRKCVERFCASSRVIYAGDCEDLAREMVTVACSIVRGRWANPLVAAVKAILRCYVVVVQLGCMRKSSRAGEDDPYNTGDYDAHAWAMMLPTIGVERMLRGGNMRLCRRARVPWKAAGLPVMSMDGTAVKEVYPRARARQVDATEEYGPSGRARFATSHRMPRVLKSINSDSRLTTSKIRFPEDADCYFFVLESLLLEGVTCNGCTVKELFYTTATPGGRAYGARYESLFSSEVIPHMGYNYADGSVSTPAASRGACPVTLEAARLYTEEDVALAESVMGRFVPIPPYKEPEVWWDADTARVLGLPPPTAAQSAAAAAAVQHLVDALKGQGVKVTPWHPGRGHPVVITHGDLVQPDFVGRFAQRLSSEDGVGEVCVRAESVSPGRWEAHVRVCVNE